jgi:hypothetical protein
VEQASRSEPWRRLMPFVPELFSAPVLARIEGRRHARLTGVPFSDGLMTGEVDALVGSFAGEPEVHQPVSGASKAPRRLGDSSQEIAQQCEPVGAGTEEVPR